MPRWRTRFALAGLALTLACGSIAGAAAPALAITHGQADRIALTKLQPGHQRGRIVVFTLPVSLKRTDWVSESGPGAAARRVPSRRGHAADVISFTLDHRPLRRSGFLYWEDLASGAEFEHPSVLLIVEQGSGRVLRRQVMSFYPLIDGRVPAFLITGSRASTDSRYRIYSNLPVAKRSHKLVDWPHLWFTLAAAAQAPNPTLPNVGNRFHDSCLIAIGDRNDAAASFGRNIQAMKALSGQLGFGHPPYDATDAASLEARVRQAIADGCKDIVIFIAGHGYPAPGSNIPHPSGGMVPERADPTTIVGHHTRTNAGGNVVNDAAGNPIVDTDVVTAPRLGQIIKAAQTPDQRSGKDQNGPKFKVLISSCFSGRWEPVLSGTPNLVYVGASSSATEFSWGAVASGHFGTYQTQTGQEVTNPNANPNKLSEFVNALLIGLATQLRLPASATLDLPHLLDHAVNTHGANFVGGLGWVHPGSVVIAPVAPPVSGVDFGGVATSDFSYGLTGQFAGGLGPWTVHWDFGDGTSDTKTLQQPPNWDPARNTLILQDGHTWSAPGTYDVTLSVTDKSGASAARTRQFTITATPVSGLDFAGVKTADLSYGFTGQFAGGYGAFTIHWDYGDGTSETKTIDQPPNWDPRHNTLILQNGHTWSTAGTYTVSVTVTDKWGSTQTKSRQFTVSPPLVASILAPTGTAFVDDNNPVLSVMGDATGGIGPYSFSWTTNPPGSSAFPGQTRSLTIPGAISLTNGRASATFTLTATDSQNQTSMATGNVIIACNTTKMTTFDFGAPLGVEQVFQACGKINTHGVQPVYIRFTVTGNQFGGAFNVFETLASATCPTTTTTVIECDPAKLLSENPFGYVGGIFGMASALASGQSVKIEEFDGSHTLLGSITATLP